MKFQYSGNESACTIIQRFWYMCIIICAVFSPDRVWSIDPAELQPLQLFYENDLFGDTNEPAVRLSWQRKWRLLNMELFDVLSYDLISRAGLTLGNVKTSTSAGGEIRFGYHIPQDCGSDVIRAKAGVSAPVIEGSKSGITSLGAHAFVSSQVEAVLHDIFLDGNAWQESPGIEKKSLAADLSLGASFSINLFKLTY